MNVDVSEIEKKVVEKINLEKATEIVREVVSKGQSLADLAMAFELEMVKPYLEQIGIKDTLAPKSKGKGRRGRPKGSINKKKVGRKKKAKKKARAKYKCSVCGSASHTKRNCPKK